MIGRAAWDACRGVGTAVRLGWQRFGFGPALGSVLHVPRVSPKKPSSRDTAFFWSRVWSRSVTFRYLLFSSPKPKKGTPLDQLSRGQEAHISELNVDEKPSDMKQALHQSMTSKAAQLTQQASKQQSHAASTQQASRTQQASTQQARTQQARARSKQAPSKRTQQASTEQEYAASKSTQQARARSKQAASKRTQQEHAASKSTQQASTKQAHAASKHRARARSKQEHAASKSAQ